MNAGFEVPQSLEIPWVGELAEMLGKVAQQEGFVLQPHTGDAAHWELVQMDNSQISFAEVRLAVSRHPKKDFSVCVEGFVCEVVGYKRNQTPIYRSTFPLPQFDSEKLKMEIQQAMLGVFRFV